MKGLLARISNPFPFLCVALLRWGSGRHPRKLYDFQTRTPLRFQAPPTVPRFAAIESA